VRKSGQLFPTIRFLQQRTTFQFPSVTVDDGAVPHILNGANVFAPGIVEYSSFRKNDLILVKNLKGTLLSIGLSLLDSLDLDQDLKNAGIVVSTLHYLHDDIWNFQG
jgi:predicted RNA-binding protein (TIGR00451 family)